MDEVTDPKDPLGILPKSAPAKTSDGGDPFGILPKKAATNTPHTNQHNQPNKPILDPNVVKQIGQQNRDRVIKAGGNPAEYDAQLKAKHAPNNTWSNIGDFLPAKIGEGISKDVAGLSRFVANNAMNSPSLAPARELVNNFASGLDGISKIEKNTAESNQLPNTTMGGVASSAAGFAPDLIELALTPELDVAKLGKLGEVLSKGGKYAPKIANALIGKFPIQQGVKGLSDRYDDAVNAGQSNGDAVKSAFANGMKEYGKGVFFDGAASAAGKVSEIGAKAMEDSGWNKTAQLVGRKILHSTSQAAAFSAVPFISNALQGKSTSFDGLKGTAIFGGLTGIFHGEPEGKEASDGAAKEVQQRSPLIDLHNFMQADLPSIKAVHEAKENPTDLQVKGGIHADNAYRADDPEEKQEQIVASSLNGKAASVKAFTNAIAKDKQGVIDGINELPITDEQKQSAVDKVNDVHKQIDPVEKQKTAIGDQITDIDNKLVKQANNPVEEAEQDVLKEKRKGLNNQLKEIINKQQNPTENEKDDSGQSSQSESSKGRDEDADQNSESSEKGVQGSGELLNETGGDEPPVNEKKEDGTTNDSGDKSTPGEVQQPEKTEEDKTGITNSHVEKEREEDIPRDKRSVDEVSKEGKRLVDSGEVDPNELADRVISGKHTANEDEQSALQYQKQRLKNRQNALLKDSEANPEKASSNHIEYERNRELIEKNRQATEKIGNIAGRSLRMRQEEMADDYSISHMEQRAKQAKNGGELSAEEKGQVAQHAKRIEELEGKLADREEQVRKLTDQNTVDKVRRGEELDARTQKRQITKSSLRKEREDIKAELITLARKSRANIGANKIPVEFLAPMAKLARNYVMEGAVNIAQVADKIYNDLKDHLDGIDLDDIEDAIKDGFDKHLAERNEKRLAASKGRMVKKTEALKSGNYEKRVMDKVKVDKDYLDIRADLIREQALADRRIAKIAESQKAAWDKGLGKVVKYGRISKLASLPVLGKLFAAGATTMAAIPLEEQAGRFSNLLVPKGIREKSLGEQFVSRSRMKGAAKNNPDLDMASSIGKAFAKGATKGMKDAYDAVKKGGSDLQALYSKNGLKEGTPEALDFIGHLHSAIKAPFKRIAWEHSYAKRVANTIRAGFDPNDSIIDAQNRMMAYKDAERRIFMSDNKFASIFENFAKTLENGDHVGTRTAGAVLRALVPFMKVPSNIALEGYHYAGGGILSSGIKILQAIGKKDGFKSVTDAQADMILRNMKKGSIGGALAAYAFFNPQYFGGFYKSDDDQKEGAVLGLPSQLFDHPLFLSMQAYASYSKYIDAETAGKSLKQSPLLATATGLSEHIPLADQLQQISTAMGSTDKLNTFLSNEAKGQIDPAILQQVAKWTDNSDARYPEKGEGLPTQLWQTVETGLPVLRENVDDVKPYKAKKYSSYAGDN